MAFWWVNHKQTRDHEVRGGYLWSPYRNANGAFNQTYENLRHARVGDVVFSFANAQIGAVGRVTAAATPSPKPIEFGNVGDNWANEGWLVEVDFVPVPRALRPQAHAQAIAPLLPARHSPIQANGHGNQGCYLAGISDALGAVLVELMDAGTLLPATNRISEPELGPALLEDLHRIEGDLSIPDTQKPQLAKARIGQGLFRKRVILLDPTCRVTGVTETRVLIASHIKPWKDSSNAERINGHNGIMLSPHVDALFDDHLITFEDDGRIHVHESLPRDVLDRWGIDPSRRVERFRPEQAIFLGHHRNAFGAKIG
ncbi:HNH endonuclease [Arenimonas terrae]|uniref:HNH endonuclease n=1 Tax=Arenimonas terrae TaxID=2546226 RepID=A0A5C4RVG3_9GAMM|nr:HNH endonuclease signature motif containing protein [Arenimonas terrae]TNJ34831.1 HNH endonuclease [Arenimonas terrae]